MIASLTVERSNLCLRCRESANEVFVFLGNRTDHQALKKRSPSVWRNYFVFGSDGPTISRRDVGPCARAVMQRGFRTNKELTRSRVKGFCFAAHVCKVL